MNNRILGVALACATMLHSVEGLAQDDPDAEAEALAKKTQNPLADLISVPFQNNTSFSIGPEDSAVGRESLG